MAAKKKSPIPAGFTPGWKHNGVRRKAEDLQWDLLKYDPTIIKRVGIPANERKTIFEQIAYLQEVLYCSQGLPQYGGMFDVGFKRESIVKIYSMVVANDFAVSPDPAGDRVAFFQGVLARMTIARLTIAYASLGHRAEDLRLAGNERRVRAGLPEIPAALFVAICSSREGAESKMKELYVILHRWWEAFKKATPKRFLKDHRG
jgi:hypothetical protein